MGVGSWHMTDTCHGIGAACGGGTKRSIYGKGASATRPVALSAWESHWRGRQQCDSKAVSATRFKPLMVMWKCLAARSSLMQLCMMRSGSSTGIISHPISAHSLLPIIFSYRTGTVSTLSRDAFQPHTRQTPDIYAFQPRINWSPDRVGFVAPRSYALFRWIRGLGRIVWTHLYLQYVTHLVSFLSFPPPSS
jgi:hypothetical protein